MKHKLNCILLIDDNGDDNFFHQIILGKMNLAEHVEVAFDGEEALRYLQEENRVTPELIFLDINMPRINGWEFLEIYTNLSQELKAKVIIILLSTSANPEDKKRAAHIPEVIDFEIKPLSEEMLAGIMKRHFPDSQN